MSFEKKKMRNKILTLILLVFIVSCKKQEKKTIKKICNVSGSNVEISLLEDDNDKIYLSVKTDNSSLEKKNRLR
ncbi:MULTISPECIES: hypothetical protein [unclassified Tenacibaculum]|uniref:hypothetical protein n=1 Tax=unclassified Tenacibaculum TaxID=2635139 RepID=UPI00237BB0A7|nr:hypothetical protein [Tenacibaculum sp. L6]MDE0536798.1 hypothetical protein [Tenacibaculum sp. L6]